MRHDHAAITIVPNTAQINCFYLKQQTIQNTFRLIVATKTFCPQHWHEESLLDHRRSIHINIPYSNRREIRTYISSRSPHTLLTCHQQTIHRLSTLSVVTTSTGDENEYVTTRHKLTTSTWRRRWRWWRHLHRALLKLVDNDLQRLKSSTRSQYKWVNGADKPVKRVSAR